MYELMTVTVSGFAVVSQSIFGLHGRDLHWLSSISRQAGPPPCNTHSVKCYAPVICNHVSYGPRNRGDFSFPQGKTQLMSCTAGPFLR